MILPLLHNRTAELKLLPLAAHLILRLLLLHHHNQTRMAAQREYI